MSNLHNFLRENDRIVNPSSLNQKPVTTKNRREMFEMQLKSLQSDIESLKQKMSPSPAANGKRLESLDSRIYKEHAGGMTSFQLDYSTNPTAESLQDSNASIDYRIRAEMASLKSEITKLKQERDDGNYREEVLQRELDALRKTLEDANHFKIMNEHLKQDIESLKLSLESSERIRKQQKELISLLQKSNAVSDNISIASLNSISTIPSVTPSLMAAENKSWLNMYDPLKDSTQALMQNAKVLAPEKSQPFQNNISTTIAMASNSLTPMNSIKTSVTHVNSRLSDPEINSLANYQYLNLENQNSFKSLSSSKLSTKSKSQSPVTNKKTSSGYRSVYGNISNSNNSLPISKVSRSKTSPIDSGKPPMYPNSNVISNNMLMKTNENLNRPSTTGHILHGETSNKARTLVKTKHTSAVNKTRRVSDVSAFDKYALSNSDDVKRRNTRSKPPPVSTFSRSKTGRV